MEPVEKISRRKGKVKTVSLEMSTSSHVCDNNGGSLDSTLIAMRDFDGSSLELRSQQDPETLVLGTNVGN